MLVTTYCKLSTNVIAFSKVGIQVLSGSANNTAVLNRNAVKALECCQISSLKTFISISFTYECFSLKFWNLQFESMNFKNDIFRIFRSNNERNSLYSQKRNILKLSWKFLICRRKFGNIWWLIRCSYLAWHNNTFMLKKMHLFIYMKNWNCVGGSYPIRFSETSSFATVAATNKDWN